MAHLPATEVKKLVACIAGALTVGGQILADGKVGIGDLARLPQLLGELQGLTGVDYKAVLPQVADLDADELTDLATTFKAAFNLADDTVERVVENGIDIVLQVVQAVAVLKGIYDRVIANLPKTA